MRNIRLHGSALVKAAGEIAEAKQLLADPEEFRES